MKKKRKRAGGHEISKNEGGRGQMSGIKGKFVTAEMNGPNGYYYVKVMDKPNYTQPPLPTVSLWTFSI